MISVLPKRGFHLEIERPSKMIDFTENQIISVLPKQGFQDEN